MNLFAAELFAGGTRRSKVLRFVLWVALFPGIAIGTFGHGHILRRSAVVAGLLCLLGAGLEYRRVKARDDSSIEPLDLKERAR